MSGFLRAIEAMSHESVKEFTEQAHARGYADRADWAQVDHGAWAARVVCRPGHGPDLIRLADECGLQAQVTSGLTAVYEGPGEADGKLPVRVLLNGPQMERVEVYALIGQVLADWDAKIANGLFQATLNSITASPRTITATSLRELVADLRVAFTPLERIGVGTISATPLVDALKGVDRGRWQEALIDDVMTLASTGPFGQLPALDPDSHTFARLLADVKPGSAFRLATGARELKECTEIALGALELRDVARRLETDHDPKTITLEKPAASGNSPELGR